MIATEIVTKVRRLLADGQLSQRSIARLTGVSRGSVGTIASGKRPDYRAPGQPEDDLLEEPAGPPERCPGCGGKVYMPCRLCHMRTTTAKKPRLALHRGAAPAAEPLELNLRPEHRARYEQVCAWRRENGGMEGDEKRLPMHSAAAGTAIRITI